jgi:hypothetical protein
VKTYADLVNGDVVTDEKHIELTYLNSHPARTGGKLMVYLFKRIGGDVIMRFQFPTAEVEYMR